MVINLYKENPETFEREILGSISESQLDFLMENLEEDVGEDEEYFLNAGTLDFLKCQKADEKLIRILEKALSGTSDGVDIVYLVE